MGGETESNIEWFDLTERDSDSQASVALLDGLDGAALEHEDDAKSQQVILAWSRDGYPCTKDNIQIPIAATCCIELSDPKANAWTMTCASSMSCLSLSLQVRLSTALLAFVLCATFPDRRFATLQDWDVVLQCVIGCLSGPLAKLKGKPSHTRAADVAQVETARRLTVKLSTEDFQLCLLPKKFDGASM
jgi:hypothetical protein